MADASRDWIMPNVTCPFEVEGIGNTQWLRDLF
jgi:hypothetical protein